MDIRLDKEYVFSKGITRKEIALFYRSQSVIDSLEDVLEKEDNPERIAYLMEVIEKLKKWNIEPWVKNYWDGKWRFSDFTLDDLDDNDQ